jgi:hypothetical protein
VPSGAKIPNQLHCLNANACPSRPLLLQPGAFFYLQNKKDFKLVTEYLLTGWFPDDYATRGEILQGASVHDVQE